MKGCSFHIYDWHTALPCYILQPAWGPEFRLQIHENHSEKQIYLVLHSLRCIYIERKRTRKRKFLIICCCHFWLFRYLQSILTGFYYGGLWENIFVFVSNNNIELLYFILGIVKLHRHFSSIPWDASDIYRYSNMKWVLVTYFVGNLNISGIP